MSCAVLVLLFPFPQGGGGVGCHDVLECSSTSHPPFEMVMVFSLVGEKLGEKLVWVFREDP